MGVTLLFGLFMAWRESYQETVNLTGTVSNQNVSLGILSATIRHQAKQIEDLKSANQSLSGQVKAQGKPDTSKLCFNEVLQVVWQKRVDPPKGSPAGYLYIKEVGLRARRATTNPSYIRIYSTGGMGYGMVGKDTVGEVKTVGGNMTDFSIQSPISPKKEARVILFGTLPFDVLCADKFPSGGN